MKKLLIPLFAVVVLVAPFSAAQAQTLTRQDVQTITPQMYQVMLSLSEVLKQEQSRRQLENGVLASGATLLGSMSAKLGANPPPTQSEMNDMKSQVNSLAREVGNIASRRIAFGAGMIVVGQILGSISTMIASAQS